jgi:hypothetical protein
MKSAVRAAVLFGLGIAACNAGGPEQPESAQVPVAISAAEGVVPSTPLRLAVVWRQGSGATQRWISTFDVPVDKVNATQFATLDLPSKSERASLSQASDVYISCSDAEYITAPVIFPRLVVYQDADASGDLDPDLPTAPGHDRIWGISGTDSSVFAIVGFTDLEQTLAGVPLEGAECIREITQGRYTAFFMAQNYSSYVSPAGEPLATEVELSPTEFASVTMGCQGYEYSSLNNYYSDKTYAPQNVWVDANVKEDLCQGNANPCARVDIGAKLPDSLYNSLYPGYDREFLCSVVGSLDVLWEMESKLDCDRCSCSWVETDTSWVAESTQLPDNWPCAKQVKYCSTPQESISVNPSLCTLTNQRPL